MTSRAANQDNFQPKQSRLASAIEQSLPPVLRVQSIVRLPAPGGGVLSRATLYHDDANFSTEWVSRHSDVRITRGSLVSVRWSHSASVIAEPVRVQRLVLIERPMADLDLFQTVPPSWLNDRELCTRASGLWDSLPRGFRHLFNGMFWDGRRFQRFVMGPSSINHHHSEINGNLRHSVDVAEQAQVLARARGTPNVPIVTLAGLIHDAGKADEYRFDRINGQFKLSDAGRLIGHRDRVQHWIAAAMAAHRIIIPEAQLIDLLHALTAVRGAPRWLGLREPRSLEASILSMADRLSGESDFTVQSANETLGHPRSRTPHFKG